MVQFGIYARRDVASKLSKAALHRCITLLHSLYMELDLCICSDDDLEKAVYSRCAALTSQSAFGHRDWSSDVCVRRLGAARHGRC